MEKSHADNPEHTILPGNGPFLAAVSSALLADRVGPFELRLLASINALSHEAWGSNLQRHVSNALGRDVAIGQLYLALSRLEQKGFISSTASNPEPRKGGRSKKIFRLEASGVRALERTAAMLRTSGALQMDAEESTYGRASPAQTC